MRHDLMYQLIVQRIWIRQKMHTSHEIIIQVSDK